MFKCEAIEGLVGIERRDHPIPVAPGVAVGDILIEPVGVSVAGHIEPMATPSLAVARRGEQSVDYFLIGFRRGVLQEIPGLDLGGRQARQVEGHPSEKIPFRGFAPRLDPGLLHPCVDEPIERIVRPITIRHIRESLPGKGFKRPEGGGFFRMNRNAGKNEEQGSEPDHSTIFAQKFTCGQAKVYSAWGLEPS